MTDRDSNIASLMEVGEVSAEEASAALEEAGVNVDRAMSKLQQVRCKKDQDELEYTTASDLHSTQEALTTKLPPDEQDSTADEDIASTDEATRNRMTTLLTSACSVAKGHARETLRECDGDIGKADMEELEGETTETSTLSHEVEERPRFSMTESPMSSGSISSDDATLMATDEEHCIDRRQTQVQTQPGAFHSLDGQNARDVSVVDEETVQPEVSNPLIEEVSAKLVDVEEEDRKKREQVDKEVQEALERQRLEERENMEVAEVVTGFWCTPRARKWSLFGIIILVAAITVLAVILPTRPTLASPPPKDPIDLLSSVSLDGGKTLRTPLTPQNDAYKWLNGDANLGSYSDEKIIQRYTLATFYYSTAGASWMRNDGWVSGSDECTWFSTANDVFCSNGSVVMLDLRENNLVGTIPPEIALFPISFGELYLGENELMGPIPSESGFLTNLKELDLGGNELTGLIPAGIWLLTKLNSLALYNNGLTGTIPSQIALLTNLKKLHLYDNSLTGSIPTEICLLTALEGMYLYENGLTGTVPSEISGMTNLEWLRLSKNALSGKIPTEIALMTNLNRLWMSGNALTGTIPTEITHMTNLQWLRVSDNALTGTIATGIALMTNLEWLWLRDNSLSGTVPTEIAQMNNLGWLFLGGNELTGAIPSEIALMTSLDRLYLENNKFTGTIPTEVALMTNLEWLSLYNNSLSGTFSCPDFIAECLLSCDDVSKDRCRSL